MLKIKWVYLYPPSMTDFLSNIITQKVSVLSEQCIFKRVVQNQNLTFWRNTSPPSSLSGSITLKMEVIHSSKTLLTTHKTQDHDQQHTIGCDQYIVTYSGGVLLTMELYCSPKVNTLQLNTVGNSWSTHTRPTRTDSEHSLLYNSSNRTSCGNLPSLTSILTVRKLPNTSRDNPSSGYRSSCTPQRHFGVYSVIKLQFTSPDDRLPSSPLAHQV
jgi:hypothetical protein